MKKNIFLTAYQQMNESTGAEAKVLSFLKSKGIETIEASGGIYLVDSKLDKVFFELKPGKIELTIQQKGVYLEEELAMNWKGDAIKGVVHFIKTVAEDYGKNPIGVAFNNWNKKLG